MRLQRQGHANRLPFRVEENRQEHMPTVDNCVSRIPTMSRHFIVVGVVAVGAAVVVLSEAEDCKT